MASVSAYGVTLLFANQAKSTLAGAITNTATVAQLASGTGVGFPSPADGQGYVGTFNDATTGLLYEVVLVTQMNGDQIAAMTRAQEGTTALNWNAGDFFYMLTTAGTMATMVQEEEAAPTRIVTSSTSFQLLNTDGAVGLNRTTSVAAMDITMPVSPTNGQVIEIDDLVGNFNAYPVTMIPNSGQSIAGLPGNAVLNIDGSSWAFKFYSTGTNAGIWSFSKK